MSPTEPRSFVSWYRRDQWQQLLDAAADPETLESGYDEWLAAMNRGLDELARTGVVAQPIEVDVQALLAWCEEAGRPVDGPARAEYAAHEAARRSEGAGQADEG